MQIHNSNLARGHVFDRDFTIADFRYEGTVGPHVETERLSFTVPDGKILKLSGYAIEFYKASTGGTSSSAFVHIKIRDTLDAEKNHFDVGGFSANIATVVNAHSGIEHYIPAGFDVRILTEDLSTGGTYSYVVDLFGNLFDK